MNKIRSLINKYDTAKTIKEKLSFLIEIDRELSLLIKQESKKL